MSRKAQKHKETGQKAKPTEAEGDQGVNHPLVVGQQTNPRGLGTPLPSFAQLRLAIFEVSSSLDSQTTSKSDETRIYIFIVNRHTLKLEDSPRITSIQ